MTTVNVHGTVGVLDHSHARGTVADEFLGDDKAAGIHIVERDRPKLFVRGIGRHAQAVVLSAIEPAAVDGEFTSAQALCGRGLPLGKADDRQAPDVGLTAPLDVDFVIQLVDGVLGGKAEFELDLADPGGRCSTGACCPVAGSARVPVTTVTVKSATARSWGELRVKISAA